MFVRRVASKRGLAGSAIRRIVVKPPVEHGMVLAQSQQTLYRTESLLMEMISVPHVIDYDIVVLEGGQKY